MELFAEQLMIYRIIVLWLLSCFVIDTKFIRIGPCIFRWGEECPDPHINFFLYNRKIVTGKKVLPDENSIKNSSFNPLSLNKIIVHGYNSDMNLTSLIDMKNAYLNTSDYNVWMVDWKYVAQGPCYPVVVSNLNYVSKCIAQLITAVYSVSKLRMESSVHVVGFSLGAHLAGYIANNLRPMNLSRITGLDPALPLFVTADNRSKLDKSDALFVDVIHTDALVEGKLERSGHVDFYVNGGIYQPGCWNGNILDTTGCNHQRAPAYFAESITTTVGFFGWPCPGFWHYINNMCPFMYPDTIMGEYCDAMSRGYYLVKTANKPPFAIGHNISVSPSWKMITVLRDRQSPVFNYSTVFKPSKLS